MPARRSRKPTKPKAPSKKKVAAVAAPTVTNPDYIDPDDGGYKMPPERFWKWRALEADIQLQALTLSKAKSDFEAIVRTVPELSQLRRIQEAARRRMNEMVKEHQAFKAEVEAESGLNMAHCAIDDVTGRISVVGPPEAPKPPENTAPTTG